MIEFVEFCWWYNGLMSVDRKHVRHLIYRRTGRYGHVFTDCGFFEKFDRGPLPKRTMEDHVDAVRKFVNEIKEGRTTFEPYQDLFDEHEIVKKITRIMRKLDEQKTPTANGN